MVEIGRSVERRERRMLMAETGVVDVLRETGRSVWA